MTTAGQPIDPGALRARLAAELALPPRLRHVLLLLAALGGATIVLALLLTEPALPVRTRVAFVVLLAIALCWAVWAGWVLTRRRPLFARHEVVAAWMAVTFSTVFVAGSVAMQWTPAGARAWPFAALTGLAMLAAAIVLLVRARRRVRALSRRRAEIERLLAAAGEGTP